MSLEAGSNLSHSIGRFLDYLEDSVIKNIILPLSFFRGRHLNRSEQETVFRRFLELRRRKKDGSSRTAH